MHTNIATLTAAALVAILSAAPARAALTQVNVRIEGRTKTLFEGPILTEGHDVSSYKADGGSASENLAEHECNGLNNPENTTPGPTPTAASVDAMDTIGETDAMAGQWYSGYDDYFVKQWGSEAENAESGSRSWGVLVNNVYTDVGGCQYELTAGDEVLWIYNAFASRPILGLFASDEHYSSGTRPLTATAALGQPFEVEVDAFTDHGESRPPSTPERTVTDTAPYAGAEVAPVQTSARGFETVQAAGAETVLTDGEGKASITFTTPGWHRLMAGTPLLPQTEEEKERGVIPEEEAIRSNRLDVCVPAAGQTTCGEPPAEDQVRTPPRYLHNEEPTQQEQIHQEQEQSQDNEQSQEHPGESTTDTNGPPASTSTVSGATTTQPAAGTEVRTSHTETGPRAHKSRRRRKHRHIHKQGRKHKHRHKHKR